MEIMHKGFTLIEVLTSLVVMAIFAGLLFPNYRRINSRAKILNSAQTLVQNGRRAQEMALSAEEVEDSSGDRSSRDRYGVKLEPDGTEYVLYAKDEAGSDIEIERIEFEQGVMIKETACDGTYGAGLVRAEYKPPEPETFLDSESEGECEQTALVTLGFEQLSLEVDVKFNGAGLIYVKE